MIFSILILTANIFCVLATDSDSVNHSFYLMIYCKPHSVLILVVWTIL